MSRQQQREVNDRARAFIDKAIKINRDFGMGVAVDVYEDAVKGSAQAAAALVPRSSQVRRQSSKPTKRDQPSRQP